MNTARLNSAISEFMTNRKMRTDYYKNNWDERISQKEFYQAFTREKLLTMTEEEFLGYISKLWSMIIWGNKQYVVDKLIADNGFDNLKKQLVELLYDGLKNIPQVVLYGDFKERTPILAFNIQGMDSFQVADLLNNKYDIAIRCGTHCAPLMHQHLNTVKSGIVRVSLSFMNTKEEIQFFIKAIQEISEGNYDN